MQLSYSPQERHRTFLVAFFFFFVQSRMDATHTLNQKDSMIKLIDNNFWLIWSAGQNKTKKKMLTMSQKVK